METPMALDQQDSSPVSIAELIPWWENRRPWYNLAICIPGVICFFLDPAVRKEIFSDDLWLAIVLFILSANILYTMGWAIEAWYFTMQNKTFRKTLFRRFFFWIYLLSSIALSIFFAIFVFVAAAFNGLD